VSIAAVNIHVGRLSQLTAQLISIMGACKSKPIEQIHVNSNRNTPDVVDNEEKSDRASYSLREDFHLKYSLTKLKLPKRIILVRHGESLGNLDENAYTIIPDSRIPLTETGKKQAYEVGQKIRDLVGPDEPITIYTSPYIRTKQTLACMMSALSTNPVVSVREEPRLTGKADAFDRTCFVELIVNS
jgi:hypothetical protein